MNFYETRLAELKDVDLHKQVESDGRTRRITNDQYWDMLKVGDKVFVTKWFLRNIHEVHKVKDAALNGLTIIEKGEIYDREGKWQLGAWHGCNHKVLWFEEIATPMSFKYCINQKIWKINEKELG